MNQINVKRMLLAGLVMYVVWIFLEIVVEHVLAGMLIGQTSSEMWSQSTEVGDWSAMHHVANNFIAIVNCTIMIWLYASLRPMYGVGAKTALITSAFGVFLCLALFVNFINLGFFPLRTGLLEILFVSIEFPLAMIVGAGVYEGAEKQELEAAN